MTPNFANTQVAQSVANIRLVLLALALAGPVFFAARALAAGESGVGGSFFLGKWFDTGVSSRRTPHLLPCGSSGWCLFPGGGPVQASVAEPLRSDP
jgi:hypothetical protein